MRYVVKVSNITCAQCAKTIENHFKNDISAKVLVNAKKVIFEYDENKYDTDYLAEELRKIGYYAILSSEEQNKRKRIDKIDLIVGLIFTIPLLWTMFYHFGVHFLVPDFMINKYVQLALATPVQFFVGRRFYKTFFHELKGKNLGMDSLVVLGTTSAYLYSLYIVFTSSEIAPHLFFETSATIITMVLIGNYFENRVKEKTSDTLQSLVSLSSKEARIIDNNEEKMIPIDKVKIDDIVIILANEKIPVDGIIIEGDSYFDESMMTGESMPTHKQIGDSVIGSSVNLLQTIKVRVNKVGSDTVLSKIIKTVEDASLIKPKAQRVADKIASFFVPGVVIISVLTVILWMTLGNQNFGDAISKGIAVLVISCPCALGLATPTSISVSSGIAFKEGILYKGGEFFEIANKITKIAFDKTGTLTKGEPSVTDFYGDNDTLKYTASLEYHSNHPLAKAINVYYKSDITDVTDFKQTQGIGISGMVNNKLVIVGSLKNLAELNLENPFKNDYEILSKQGKTVVFTIIDNKVSNMIAIRDEIKQSAKMVIEELIRRNITPYMITGDNTLTANSIAKELGITNIFSEVLPHEKAEYIKELQKDGSITAFVGDGVNDAPALKIADVSFAIGTGSDIAIDTADVTLMTHDLGLVIKAIDLSQKTLKNIYQNFFWAFSYNIVTIPLAAFGILSPIIAGIGMAFSSITVVLNALRLKRYKFKKIGEEK